jgi:DNA-binding NarL/FixJ family response regulator
MNKIRLLIASDFQLARTGLHQIVNALEDAEVVAESELQTALPTKVQEIGPDVVLLDLAVPRPHNLPALSQVLKNKQIKVVVLSTNENIGYVRSLVAAGVHGYVLRSASAEELFMAIRTAHQGRYFIDSRLSDALAEMLVTGRLAESSRAQGSLSKREEQVLAAIARGFTSQEIAQQLQLSHKTVETYRARIYEKLGLRTRAELVGYAMATGLLTGKIGEALWH